MIYDSHVKVDGTEYTVIAEAGEYGYSWSVAALLRDDTGSLFFASDSGCSCGSFGDYMKRDDLTPVASWQEAANLAQINLYDNDWATDFAEACLRARREGKV